MSDTSTQLAKFVKRESTVVGKNNTPAVNVHYTRIDGESPKDMTVRYLVGKLPEASKNVLQTLSTGDEFVVVKQKEGEYWNLKEFKTADTFVAPPPKAPWGGSSSSSSGSKNTTSSTYNTAGVKVGAVLHDAVALAGTGSTTAKVAKIARELLTLSYQLETEVNAGTYITNTTTLATDTEENYTNDYGSTDAIPF